MHCVSNYPLSLENSQLGYINHLKEISGRDVGYSSHDKNWENCLIAATLGVTIIERHITLSKTSIGLDHSSSSDPEEFKKLSEFLKAMPKILKTSKKRIINQGEMLNKQNLGRSLYAKKDFIAGEYLDLNDFEELVPQVGLSYNDFKKIKSKKLIINLKKGKVLKQSHFENNDELEKINLEKIDQI